jgi:protein ImuB
VETISDEQLDLLDQKQREGQMELDDLIERLAIRLGPDGLMRPQLVESYVPEKAVRQVDENGAKSLAVDKRGSVGARPVQLLTSPVEIGVMASAPPDGDGSPVSFVYQGINRRIAVSCGPERIRGQWWEGPAKTRDYFDVEDSAGTRFWIFRVVETGRWFLQGQWG